MTANYLPDKAICTIDKKGKSFFFKTMFFCLLIMVSYLDVFSQTKLSMLLGKWSISKFEYPDSTDQEMAAMEKKAIGNMITFETGGKFISISREHGKVVDVASGTYKISEDGKYIYEDDRKNEIIKLTPDKLEMKVSDELIIHLNKIK